jgi:hypothetical protein
MVQISLFDFQGPPEPISGEAFTLSPLDVFAFAPIGAVRSGGEKVVTTFASALSKIFSGSKGALPSATGSITSAGLTIGARGGGAPFRSGTSLLSKLSLNQQSGFITKTPLVQTATTQTNKLFPTFKGFTNPFTGKVSPNVAIGGGAVGAGTIGLFRLTEPGTDGKTPLDGALDLGDQVSKFARENPLIIAAGIGLLAIGVLK